MTYVDGILSSTRSPGWPGGDAWRTDVDIDEHGRPTRNARYFGSDSDAFTNDLEYASPWHALPTTLKRGRNGTASSVTSFTYDDFGRLVQTVSPDHGTVRWEYDLADNPIKERVGVGTALVRTAVTTYDSLGRITTVDNDLEHPVTCTAGSSAAIADEEFRYDVCGTDVPPGFNCTNGTGRLVMARAISHCQGADVVKQGRWYAYDGLGRMTSVGFGTSTGTTWSDVSTMPYTYTSGSRLTSAGNPISIWRTNVAYLATEPWAVGAVTAGNSGVLIANSLSFEPFGPVRSYRVGVALSNPSRDVWFAAARNSDGSLASHRWYNRTTRFPLTSVDYMNQSFTYNGAGLPVSRVDSAVHTNRRFYQYDSLMRLTCEAKGDGTTAPTAADCVPSSARRMGLFTYTSGLDPSSPPDNRLTANLNMTGYQKVDTYAYANGSNEIAGISHAGGGSIVLGHDDLGRRTFDYDSSNATLSRRNYTYLPNGQLATISGRKPNNTPYTITFRYDTEGRMTSMSRVAGSPFPMQDGTWQFFWDDASRLIAVRHSLAGTITVWSYHYLDGHQPAAATREITTTGGTFLTRFWFLADERGLIHRVLDSSGTEHFNASYAVSGWRQVNSIATNMWVPFLLPGQVEIPATFAPGSGGTERPGLTMNRYRAYDFATGGFLSPDDADVFPRTYPEGFQYGRGNHLAYVDPSGGWSLSWYYTHRVPLGGAFEMRCRGPNAARVMSALQRASMDLQKCDKGLCQFFPDLKKNWLAGLTSGTWGCSGDTMRSYFDESYRNYYGNPSSDGWAETAVYRGHTWISDDAINHTGRYDADVQLENLRALTDFLNGYIPTVTVLKANCLKATVAHEALHKAFAETWVPGLPARSFRRTFKEREEDWAKYQVSECITCP